MMAFKGMTQDMTATYGKGNMRYEIGKTVVEEQSKTTRTGMHCAENPLDCLKWYPLGGKNRYFLVEAAGSIDEETTDSRIACTQMTVVKELTVKELAGHAMVYMVKHPKREWNVKSSCLYLGETAEGREKHSIAIARGRNPRVCGRKGSICGLILEPEEGIITAAKLFVAGEDGKEDAWYTLNGNRELVEVEG